MKTKSMTEGKSLPLLFKFALPLMAGNVFQELYSVTDTIIVGQFLGVDALAAIGIGGWATWMMLSIIQGFTQGFSVLAAQRFGAYDTEGVKKNMGNSLVLSAVITLILLVLGQLIVKPLLVMLNTPAEIFDDALLYLRLFYAGCPILMAYNYAASHLRAFGNSKAPLYAMIFASIVNIGLDLLFVGPFGWGIAGAIIATLIAQFVAAIYSVTALLKIDFLSFKKEDFILDKKRSKKQMVIGFPMALQNAIISIGGIIVQLVVNRYGIAYIAGFTATNRMYTLLETAAISYGHAMTTFVGQNVGAKKYKRIGKGLISGHILGTVTSFFIMAAMLIFGKELISLFITGTPQEIAEATGVAWKYLFVMTVFLPILYSLHIFKSSIIGFGNSTIPMGSGIAELVLRVAASFTLPVLFGKMSLFYAEPFAWIAGWSVLVPGYFYCVKKYCRKLQ